MPLAPGTRIGPYEVVSLLGKGGMGEVYRARDPKLKRDVAVKVLPSTLAGDSDRMQRFLREAEVLASLNHPNIAQIYGFEDSGDTRAIVMELVEGETLAEIIRRGPIPLDQTLDYAKQILGAFEYAHDRPKPIIHRDLKPANVKVTPEGVVKVLDFGLAKALAEERTEAPDSELSPTLTLGPTIAGVILGTAAYMSPEQAKGKTLDRRTDIWSFGVMLYEMATGDRLFKGEDQGDVLASVIKEQPNLDPAPARLRSAIARCIRKDKHKRWYSMEDVRFALDEPADASVSAPTGTGVQRQPKAGFAWVPWIAVGVFALIAAALAAVHFREQPAERQVLQYNVPIPENTALQQLSLSPDGHYLAIAGNGDRAPLMVRSLDSLQMQPLPGTDGAAYPFWSPDSRYIGFFADDKLKKIAVIGGPAQTLCDAPVPRGGTWGKDGTIVFAPGNGDGGLSRVPAAGGVAVNITKPDEGNHRQPFFLPDGHRLLYLANSGKLPGIYVASIDDKGQPRRLALDQSAPKYVAPINGSPNAHLLFVRDQTLMAQPVDPSTLENRGDVFPVAERVPRGAQQRQLSLLDVGHRHVGLCHGSRCRDRGRAAIGLVRPRWKVTLKRRDASVLSRVRSIPRRKTLH